MAGITADDLLAELAQYAIPEYDRDHELTAKDAAPTMGLTVQQAKLKLDELVEAGVWQARTVRVGMHRIQATAYRRAQHG